MGDFAVNLDVSVIRKHNIVKDVTAQCYWPCIFNPQVEFRKLVHGFILNDYLRCDVI